MYTFNITKTKFLLLNFCIILIYSFIYYVNGNEDNFIIPNQDKIKKNKLTYIDSLYLSSILYSTIGTVEFIPKSNLIKLIYISQIVVLISMLIVFTHII